MVVRNKLTHWTLWIIGLETKSDGSMTVRFGTPEGVFDFGTEKNDFMDDGKWPRQYKFFKPFVEHDTYTDVM